MDTKNKLRVVLGNLFLLAALLGSITLNKTLLRPQLSHSKIGQILTGSLPNFLAALLISLAFANPILAKKPKHGRMWMYLMACLVCALLALEEFKPMWGGPASTMTYWTFWPVDLALWWPSPCTKGRGEQIRVGSPSMFPDE